VAPGRVAAVIEAGNGCIVNIASTAGVHGGRQRAAYCAAQGRPGAAGASAPVGRLGTAAEIADTVAYLASDGAGCLQGTVLMADGGVTA
jgi:NAD(P)-dependent dehydrogenase (short-subunit alcohol dehydrogenase family)